MRSPVSLASGREGQCARLELRHGENAIVMTRPFCPHPRMQIRSQAKSRPPLFPSDQRRRGGRLRAHGKSIMGETPQRVFYVSYRCL